MTEPVRRGIAPGTTTAPLRPAVLPPLLAAVGIAAAVLTGCAASPAPAPTTTPSAAIPPPAASPPPTDAPAAPEGTSDAVVGTVLRFTSDRTSIDVTVQEDSPAVRDLLSRLPLDLELEDLADREKIAYLSPELEWAGSPGSDPDDGDLIYYTPWGNLGFYYDAEGIDYSDATLHIGTYEATLEQLELLEGSVTVEVVG